MSENTVEVSDVRGGPGAILRQARVAKGLDATAVAAMLHLSEAKLHALETDDYDSLPEPVFIRGYLRNYARLLDEPETPVLDAYARHQPTLEISEQPPLDSHVAEEVSSNHDAVKLVSAGIAVILIVLPLIWWWDNLELAAEKIVGSVTTDTEEEVPTSGSSSSEGNLAGFIPPPPPGSAESEEQGEAPPAEAETTESPLEITPAPEPVEPTMLDLNQGTDDAGSISIPLPQTASEKVESSASAIKDIVEQEAPVALVVPVKPTVKQKAKSVINAIIRKPKPKPKPVVAAMSSDGTLFEFTESAWVKVRDANNQVILIGEYKKGTQKKLSGRTPYKVVLGNSSAVKVMVDGKTANLDQYSSGGVARFTIQDGKIGNP